jgi:hypothetical protein
MTEVRLRSRQWALLERLVGIDERLGDESQSGLIHVGRFNQGAFIVSPTVADPGIDEADLTVLEQVGLLNVVSHTRTLIRLRVAQAGFDAVHAHRAQPDAHRQHTANRYQVEPPREIQEQTVNWIATGRALQQQGQLGGAIEAYRRAWGVKLSNQPANGRFHKGAELSWIASAYIQAGSRREGVRWWLAAFIEDAISRVEDSPTIRDELHWPAAQALRQLGLGEQTLSDISARARDSAQSNVIHDPMTVFVALGLDDLLEQVRERTAPLPPSTVRVFVSSPGDVGAERILVADICLELGTILQRDIRALLWEGAGPRHPESPPFPAEITGSGPQAVINNRIRDELGGYDIYVGMMWLRMGTPTENWRSGTEAEFRYALQGYQREGRPQKLFFYTKRPRGSEQRSADAAAFIAELEREMGLPQRFRTRDDLRTLLINDLGRELRATVGNSNSTSYR